ncbi:MAG TPA: hypothetical protein P5526_17720 [Anaerolineae bacterium]|nr:hypothetical protein [Anaerolineae bacterium]
MNKLRFWMIALILWLIFIFNIERINAPFDIRSYTYVFVAFAAVIALTIPKTRRISYLALLLIPVPGFLLYKALGGGQNLWGPALPLTVTQVSAIVLTGLISRQISYGLQDVEKLVTDITSGYIGKLPQPFSETQDTIYKELRRARHYHRPLSVVTLNLNDESVQVALPKIVMDVQKAMMKEYILAGVTRVLDENVSDFGTIALRNKQFVVVLPEIDYQEASKMAQDLQKLVHEKLKVRLNFGVASFPTEAITFEALVNIASNGSLTQQDDQQKSESMLVSNDSDTIASVPGVKVSNSNFMHSD